MRISKSASSFNRSNHTVSEHVIWVFGIEIRFFLSVWALVGLTVQTRKLVDNDCRKCLVVISKWKLTYAMDQRHREEWVWITSHAHTPCPDHKIQKPQVTEIPLATINGSHNDPPRYKPRGHEQIDTRTDCAQTNHDNSNVAADQIQFTFFSVAGEVMFVHRKGHASAEKIHVTSDGKWN